MMRINKVVTMKKIFLTSALLGILNFAQAITINAPSDMTGTGALVGTYAYLWDVGPINLSAGQQITSASITFTGVTETLSGNGNDISVDAGSIFSGMGFSGTGSGVPTSITSLPAAGTDKSYTDNDASGDAFQKDINSGKAVNLGTELFPKLNVAQTFTFTFFTTSELAALNSYITGLWGFEIDPDCHFNVTNICFTYTVGTTNKTKAPDAPATAGLLGLVLLGMFVARRKFVTSFEAKDNNASFPEN
jgi:hypothetical protein